MLQILLELFFELTSSTLLSTLASYIQLSTLRYFYRLRRRQQQQVKHLRYFSQEETRQQRDATRCSNNRFNTETEPLDSFSLAKGLTIFSPNSLSFLILSLSFFPLPPSLFGSGCFRVSSLNRKTQQVLDGLCLEANK